MVSTPCRTLLDHGLTGYCLVVVNLISIDAQVLNTLSHLTVLVPNALEVILAFISLYILLGWNMLPGIAIMVLATPFATIVSR